MKRFPKIALLALALTALLAGCPDAGGYNGESYSVEYHANGATGSVPVDAIGYSDGTIMFVMYPYELELVGYEFESWNTAADSSGTRYNAMDALIIAGMDIDLYAQWSLAAISLIYVSYDIDDGTGTVPATQAYEPGDTLTVAGTAGITKAGFTMAGWNTRSDGGGTQHYGGSQLTAGDVDLTLYALWTTETTFQVSYDKNNAGATGAVPSDTNNYLSGSTATVHGKPALLSLSGYSFSHWNTDAGGTGTDYDAGAELPVDANLTLYAIWEALPARTLSYDFNGGTGTALTPWEGYEGLNVEVRNPPANLWRNGFVFKGWNTAANGSGTAYSPYSFLRFGTADVVLYARWVKITGVSVSFVTPADETITLGPDQTVARSGSMSVSITQSFDEYRWYIDGVALAGLTGQSAAIAMSPYAYGNHALTVAVRRGARWFSKSLYFTVKE